ncbi:hypothetical protein ABPG75_013868 [Micractinium tetrahymenae]
MGLAQSAPAPGPFAGKENGGKRTVVALKKQRLSKGGASLATVTRRETSVGAEHAPAQGVPLGVASNRVGRPPPPPAPAAPALPGVAQVATAEATRQSDSYRAFREWVAQKLPPKAGLPAGEERQQHKPSILKPLNMRPDYAAVSMVSGIRELTQNWIDRYRALAATTLGAGAEVRCEEWAPSVPAGCFAHALLAEPAASDAAGGSGGGSTGGGSVLLGYLAAFRDGSGRLCYELCNCGTSLSLDILTLGSSSKRGGGSTAAGAFGDGMKTEANGLVAQGVALTIATANTAWEFCHKVLEDCEGPQLCVTSTAGQRSQPDTVALVAGAKEEWFRREDYLVLQVPYDSQLRAEPKDLRQVSGIEVLTEQRFHGRVYVRGIFFTACTNLQGMGLHYLGGHATFPILGIGRGRAHLHIDKLVAALPALAKHLEGDPPAQRRLVELLYDQLATSSGSNAARHIYWYTSGPHCGRVFMFAQGLSLTTDKLVELFLERHGASALLVGPGAEVKSADFLQCKPAQVSSDLLAVLRHSVKCPTEEALMKSQVARLSDPASDFDFSAAGEQGVFLHELQREVLAVLAPHVTPANLRFKQLAGNRRMVIPFEHRQAAMYAVDVAALDPRVVHEAAAKVCMPRSCPASGCGCIRLALLNQMVEAVAERCKLPRAELQSAVLGRVLDQACSRAGRRWHRRRLQSRGSRDARPSSEKTRASSLSRWWTLLCRMTVRRPLAAVAPLVAARRLQGSAPSRARACGASCRAACWRRMWRAPRSAGALDAARRRRRSRPCAVTTWRGRSAAWQRARLSRRAATSTLPSSRPAPPPSPSSTPCPPARSRSWPSACTRCSLGCCATRLACHPASLFPGTRWIRPWPSTRAEPSGTTPGTLAAPRSADAARWPGRSTSTC